MSDALAPVWARVTDLDVVSGSGCWVRDVGGEEYLDFTSGVAVTSTGHCHPKVVQAIKDQAERFVHAQVNCYRHDRLVPLAERLAGITPASIETFFFANSGAEATEGAVKLAKQATRRPNVIVFSGSFHGRTHLTMAMTTSRTGYRALHAPLPSGVFVAPFPEVARCQEDLDAEVDRCLAGLRHLLASQTSPAETAAVVLEPVLGEGGYVPSPPRFITGVVEICREHEILFVADEVQAGFGRTGRMFAVEHYGVEPDIMLMAKGIASGFPISAIGARRAVMERWTPGSHGGTYGGNPMGCAAALATIDVLTESGFLDNVAERGEQLRAGLRELATPHDVLGDVRGLGLMVASDLRDPAVVPKLLRACQDEHLLLMNAGTYGSTIRWMPPLVVDAGEIDTALRSFANALARVA